MNLKLQNATNLYMEGIRDGRVREAVTKYTGERYTQHSTGVRNGVEGFVEFFEPFIERCPNRDIRVVRSIVDGQYVFVHVFQDINNGEAQWVTTDLFDTDQDDKIIEHWDVIAAYQVPNNSNIDQLNGPTDIEDLEKTVENKALIRNFMCDVMVLGDGSKFDSYVEKVLVEHMDSETPSLEKSIGQYNQVVRVIGQGHFVVAYSRVLENQKEFARFDIFRVSDGLIKERWVNQEMVFDKNEWGNGGKF